MICNSMAGEAVFGLGVKLAVGEEEALVGEGDLVEIVAFGGWR